MPRAAAPPPTDGSWAGRFLLVARVAVGDWHEGLSSTLVPDRKPGSANRYHSTVNCMASPSIFVAYHDAQALPEYLVTFREPGAGKPPAPAAAPVAAPSAFAAPAAAPGWLRPSRSVASYFAQRISFDSA